MRNPPCEPIERIAILDHTCSWSRVRQPPLDRSPETPFGALQSLKGLPPFVILQDIAEVRSGRPEASQCDGAAGRRRHHRLGAGCRCSFISCAALPSHLYCTLMLGYTFPTHTGARLAIGANCLPSCCTWAARRRRGALALVPWRWTAAACCTRSWPQRDPTGGMRPRGQAGRCLAVACGATPAIAPLEDQIWPSSVQAPASSAHMSDAQLSEARGS